MANFAKERSDLESFIRYKFRLRIKKIENTELLRFDSPEIDFLELIDNSNRKKVFDFICDSIPQEEFDIGDLFNICLKLEGKEAVIPSKNYMQEIINKIPGLNKNLGTVHDEGYDEFLRFQDEVNDFGIISEENND